MIVYAHRGENHSQLENTKAAFDAAVAHGFRALEFDLVRLRDDSVVVFHDDDLKRLAGRDLRPADLNYAEFREVFPQLLSVYEFVTHYGRLGLDLNFEIKDDVRTFELIEPLLGLCDSAVISSFHHEIVDHARARGVAGAYLFDTEADIAAAHDTFVSAPRIHIDTALVPRLTELPPWLPSAAAADAAGREIFVFTINTPADAFQLLTEAEAAGHPVAGFYTDTAELAPFDSQYAARALHGLAG